MATTTAPELAEGMDVFWFTKGNKGLLCKVSTIWPRSYSVTIMPYSRNESSVTVSLKEIKYGAKFNSSTIHYFRSK